MPTANRRCQVLRVCRLGPVLAGIAIATLALAFSKSELVFGANKQRSEEISVFRRSWDDWFSQVAFTSKFKLNIQYAPSIEDLAEGRVDEALSATSGYAATGLLNKLGRNVRMSLEYDMAARPADVSDFGASSNVSAWVFNPFDEVTNGEVDLLYSPAHVAEDRVQRLGDTAHFRSRAEELAESADAGIHSGSILNPLSPLRKGLSNPFVVFEGGEDAEETSDIQFVEDSNSRVMVSLSKSVGSVIQTRKLIVWTEPAIPVVERIEDHLTVKDGTSWTTIVEMGSFQDCSGLLVPKTMRYYEQLTSSSGTQNPAALITWQSADLGIRNPTEEDFVIDIPSTTRVFGLKKAMPPGTERRLSLSDVGREDVQFKKVNIEIGAAALTRPEKTDGRNWIMITLNTLIVVGILLAVFLKRRGSTA